MRVIFEVPIESGCGAQQIPVRRDTTILGLRSGNSVHELDIIMTHDSEERRDEMLVIYGYTDGDHIKDILTKHYIGSKYGYHYFVDHIRKAISHESSNSHSQKTP